MFLFNPKPSYASLDAGLFVCAIVIYYTFKARSIWCKFSKQIIQLSVSKDITKSMTYFDEAKWSSISLTKFEIVFDNALSDTKAK